MMKWLIKQVVPAPFAGFNPAHAVMDFQETDHLGQKLAFLQALYQADETGLLSGSHKRQMMSILPSVWPQDVGPSPLLLTTVQAGLLHEDAALRSAARDVVRTGFDTNPTLFKALCSSVAGVLTDPWHMAGAQRAVLELFEVEASWGRRSFVSLDQAHRVIARDIKQGSDAEKALAFEAAAGMMGSTAEFNPLMWEAAPVALKSEAPALCAAAALVVPFLVAEAPSRAKKLNLLASTPVAAPVRVAVSPSPAAAMGALSPRLDEAKAWLDASVQQVGFVRRHPVRAVLGFMSPF